MLLKNTSRMIKSLVVLMLGLTTSTYLAADQALPIIDLDGQFHPVIKRNGMVATQEALATKVGVDILKQGGNAVDAAVAVGFALAVTLPKAGNIGGGGFMLVYLAETKQTIALDYRETAPALATSAMFVGSDGKVDQRLARHSFQSSGTPGTVAGLLYALENYGTMTAKQVMQPAIELARKGFPISESFALELRGRTEQLSRSAEARSVFYRKDGGFHAGGDLLIQKNLGKTLKAIAKTNGRAFYEGSIAKLIVKDAERHNGLISLTDLKNYAPVVREAVSGSYRNYDVVSMPPPSASGLHIIQKLNILEQFDIAAIPHNSAEYIHFLTSAMQFAFADRSKHLGDPGFHQVPVKALTSKTYAKKLAGRIQANKALKAADIQPVSLGRLNESPDTTHFSIADKAGNIVANTYTLNFSYGSGYMVEGAGFLLNNEMDDFAAQPGTPNGYGLIGGEANAIAPFKRPLSSMAPTIVFKDDKPFLVTGSPGGAKIGTAIVQTIINVLDHKMNIAQASSSARIHHQWLPDTLLYEPGISADTIQLLENMGYETKKSSSLGSTQSIMIRDGLFYGASDPRRPGALSLGF